MRLSSTLRKALIAILSTVLVAHTVVYGSQLGQVPYRISIVVEAPMISHSPKLKKDLETIFAYLRQTENVSVEEAGRMLDRTPYPPEKWAEGFPKSTLEKRLVKLENPPPAPTAAEAVRIADSLRWPRHWRARHRPELFILGPPKSGTTYLEACFRVAMTGNTSKQLYPDASMRWPLTRGPGGEPVWSASPKMDVDRSWSRTGYRRWDSNKEWWTYPVIARRAYNMRGFKQPYRFPPVESESIKWTLMDSTPDQIMIPEAADALRGDLKGAPFDPTFLVMKRSVVSRAYSHFLLFTELRSQWGWGPEPTKVFSRKLDEQHNILTNITICRELIEEPEKVILDFNKTLLALQKCMYDPRKASQMMYLPFGFTALGVRYWFELFDAKFFKFMELDEVAKMNGSLPKLFNFFEDTFPGMKRMLPRCENASDWNSGTCTGHLLHARSLKTCGSDSESRNSQAWTRRGVPGYSKGSKKDLARYHEIGKRWSAVFDDLLQRYGRSYYKIL